VIYRDTFTQEQFVLLVTQIILTSGCANLPSYTAPIEVQASNLIVNPDDLILLKHCMFVSSHQGRFARPINSPPRQLRAMPSPSVNQMLRLLGLYQEKNG
jgi:hypothetical protein